MPQESVHGKHQLHTPLVSERERTVFEHHEPGGQSVCIAFPRHICPLYTVELRIHLLLYFYIIAFVYWYCDYASTVLTAVCIR